MKGDSATASANQKTLRPFLEKRGKRSFLRKKGGDGEVSGTCGASPKV